MLFVIVWFFVDAHKWFKGPKINIEVCLDIWSSSPFLALNVYYSVGDKLSNGTLAT